MNVLFYYSLFIFALNFNFTLGLSIPKLAQRAEQIPQFVKDFAPVVFLDKEEEFFPSDIAKHIESTAPFIEKTAIDPAPSISVDNLDSLNKLGSDKGRIFLTSKESVRNKPAYLVGVIPNDKGETVTATSCAVIVTDHGDGTIDAFYMYFYSFNKGSTVLFHELGSHVGDWEHTMVRFKDGVPQALWLSQHASGQAFSYKAMEKQGDRPVVYSARGTHAVYSTVGDHDHTIPGVNLPKGPLEDYTSKGALWDPLKSAFFYTFDSSTSTFGSVDNSPVAIMNFNGRWGDAQYSGNDNGQNDFFGFKKYVDGPAGCLFKGLARKNVCPDNVKDCDIKDKVAV